VKTWITGTAAILMVAAVGVAQAQSTADFPDVRENHWAYQAVRDLADKGLVKGYPNGEFLGDRPLTRFEFATVVERLLETVSDVKAGAAPSTVVTQDDLNKIQVLVDKFQPQLDAIEADVAKARADIDALRQNISDLRTDVQDAKDLANKAQSTADASYGVGSKRKFQISGYVQGRYYAATSHEQTDPGKLHFPSGVAAPSNPVNGTYAAGTNGATFQVRRSRLKFFGQVTKNTRYTIQIDASGNSASTPVSTREGWVSYTFNNGDPAKNLTASVGQFANPFGYEGPLSSASILTPERPLAFNESTAGIFSGTDYDKGVLLVQPSGRTKYTFAAVNGSGYGTSSTPATDTDRNIDQIYRVAYFGGPKLSGGASYYNGQISYTAAAGAPYTGRKKQLLGLDAQYVPTPNLFLNGEWLGGKFEQRTYFAGATQPTLAMTTSFAPGNRVDGYYVQGGYIISPAGAHPLTLAASYDVLRRSTGGVQAGAAGGPAGSNLDDVNLGYGILYNLDPATRFRLWYEAPSKVAHAAGSIDPEKVGLITSELQVKF